MQRSLACLNKDKRQLSAVLSFIMSGKLLPAQVIYAGTTPACFPNFIPSSKSEL